MSTETNKQVIRDFFAAISGGNLAGALALCHDDVVWTIIGDTPVSKTFVGPKAIEDDLMGEVFRVVDADAGVRVDVVELIAEGEKVVARAQGTITGNYGPYNNTYCHVFTFRDGKIAEDIEYLDTTLIHRSLYGKKLVDDWS
ncbi:MAG TPA: nuclear transport factor 2 family protein [Gammaproteobacteria bacterium]|nr:nuclear transport factor 2 family protein [Gammaproteobacteria bacterium]